MKLIRKVGDLLFFLRFGRQRLDMAWDRIEGLEQQNSKLAAELAAAQNFCNDLADLCNKLNANICSLHQLINEMSKANANDVQAQIEALRRLITARVEERRPVPIVARNWREAKNLMEGTEDAQG